jgi:hypothetical protein
MAITLVAQVLFSLASPIGMYQLLRYLENNDEAVVRPLVWILWLLLAPILGSIVLQWYIYIAVCLAPS